MAKRKNVTAQSLRQGQTIYFIDYHFDKGPCETPTVGKIFLHSHKVKLPPTHEIIEKFPVSYMKNFILSGWNTYKLFYSKKRAQSYLKQCG